VDEFAPVLVTYSALDGGVAKQVLEALKRDHIGASHRLAPFGNWGIPNPAVANSAFSVVVLIVSQGWITLNPETQQADAQALSIASESRKLTVLPVIVNGITDERLPPALRIWRSVRVSENPTEAELAAVVQVVQERLRHQGPRLPTDAVALQRLAVSNFGGVNAFDVSFAPPIGGSGQWTLLAAENGQGKTSLLRALVLATIGFRRFSNAMRLLTALPHPPSRDPANEASAFANLWDGSDAAVTVPPSASPELSFEASGEPVPVWAYGCTRGSALGGPRREVETDDWTGAVATLFDRDARLIHAETWLLDLERRALRDRSGEEQALFDAVISAVAKVLPGVKRVEPGDDGIWVTTDEGRFPMATLSDGYSTTAGWVLDMLARWITLLRRSGRRAGPDMLREIRGLVIIDEIDLHLHPRWQRHIVSDLRLLFPNLSFVATTHNPLTLLGARPGEVFVLDRSVEGVGARQVDLPAGVRADQVLTGPWFGLTSTLDDSTLKLLAKHRELLARGALQTDPARLSLEEDLRQRLGSFADLAEERLGQEVAAKLDRRPATAAERAEAQRSIARILGGRA
jgi:hypothetical protein